MGGTLTVQLGVMLPIFSTPGFRVGLERGWGGGSGWCTLLGPEGPGFLLLLAVMVGGGGGWAVWVLRRARVNLLLWWGSAGADRMLRTTQWTRASLIRVIHDQPSGWSGGDVGSQF